MRVDQGLFADRNIPAFLMELMVDKSPKLARPATVADRLESGAALVRVLFEAVAGDPEGQAAVPLAMERSKPSFGSAGAQGRGARPWVWCVRCG
jgi:hypothetical protein